MVGRAGTGHLILVLAQWLPVPPWFSNTGDDRCSEPHPAPVGYAAPSKAKSCTSLKPGKFLLRNAGPLRAITAGFRASGYMINADCHSHVSSVASTIGKATGNLQPIPISEHAQISLLSHLAFTLPSLRPRMVLASAATLEDFLPCSSATLVSFQASAHASAGRRNPGCFDGPLHLPL